MPWERLTLAGAGTDVLLFNFGGASVVDVLPGSTPRICQLQYSGLTSGAVLVELAPSIASTDNQVVTLVDDTLRSFVDGPWLVPRQLASEASPGLPWVLRYTRAAADAGEFRLYWEWAAGGPLR